MSAFNKEQGTIVAWVKDTIKKPLHHWKLDETAAGVVVDYGSGGVNGTNGGCAINQAGYRGKSYYFNRSESDYITFGDITDFDQSTPFSISLWWKTNNGNQLTWISKFNGTLGWELQQQTDGDILVYICNNFGTSNRLYFRVEDDTNGMNFQDNSWHNFILSYGGTSDMAGTKVYVDGVRMGVNVITDALTGSFNNTTVLDIGRRSGTGTYYDGYLQHVKLYDIDLTEDNVRNLYQDQRYILSANSILTPVHNFPLNKPYVEDVGLLGSSALNNEAVLQIDNDRKSYYFDGSNDYVDVGNLGIKINSICFWIKLNSTTEEIMAINAATTSIEVIAGTITATGFTSPTIYVGGNISSILDTSWRHVTITTGTAVSASDFDIGRIVSTYFHGNISDVRVYTGVLTQNQIKAIMDGTESFELKINQRTSELQAALTEVDDRSNLMTVEPLPDLGDWTHVAITWRHKVYPEVMYDEIDKRLYINSVLEQSVTVDGILPEPDRHAIIGADSLKQNQAGLLFDKLMISNRQYSDSEILGLYRSQYIK